MRIVTKRDTHEQFGHVRETVTTGYEVRELPNGDGIMFAPFCETVSQGAVQTYVNGILVDTDEVDLTQKDRITIGD